MEREQLKREFEKRVLRISEDRVLKVLGVDTIEKVVDRASWSFVRDLFGYKNVDELWENVLKLKEKGRKNKQKNYEKEKKRSI